MFRRSSCNWPLYLVLGAGVLLTAAYIGLPLWEASLAQAEPLTWRTHPLELVRERATGLLTGFWFFVLGATIGSFLNVVAYRLPLGLTLVSQPSRCPYCLQPIRFRHNIPILGWLVLRGRCRVCRLPISPRYPLVELLVAVIFISLFWRELASGGASLPVRPPNRRPGVMWNVLTPQWDLIAVYLFHCCLLSILVVCALLRIDKQRIPSGLLVLALIVGVAAPLIWPAVVVAPLTGWFLSGLGIDVAPWITRLATPLVGLAAGLPAGALLAAMGTIHSARSHSASNPWSGAIAVVGLIGLYLSAAAIAPVVVLAATFWVCLVAMHRLCRRGDRSQGALCLLLGAWLLLCCWRGLSTSPWLPGATSSLLVHGLWFTAAVLLIAASPAAVPATPSEAVEIAAENEQEPVVE